METVQEPSVENPTTDEVKNNKDHESVEIFSKEVYCHSTNGVAESASANQSDSITVISENNIPDNGDVISVSLHKPNNANELNVSNVLNVATTETSQNESTGESVNISSVESHVNDSPKSGEMVSEVAVEDLNKITSHEYDIQIEGTVEVDNVGVSNDNVTFTTEILVEKHNIEKDVHDSKGENNSNNILSDLGQNIQLSDVLGSSDVTETVENNNCPVRQEVFNKEELLDILEGNDIEVLHTEVIETATVEQADLKSLEAQLALQQLTKLKKTVRGSYERFPRKTKVSKKSLESRNVNSIEDVKKDSIIKVLVQDWDDEEPLKEGECNKISEQKEDEMKCTNELEETQESERKREEPLKRSSIDSSTSQTSEGQMSELNKSEDGSQPQRRVGRVIKKKVIFDPDNPDTFTKGKTPMKNKEPRTEKEHSTKKTRVDQVVNRPKSKSPVSKQLQWKKPSPKNSKQNKRLTEVDRLLMDEGAVNMIYQLTPEAPKGKKNMRTKAEFIKKIQSSTPDSMEMKFRERKKETGKYDEEAKKIIGGKQRSSLSSSVKSPSGCEEFETHSADDSIIYRRHSSSSYSSSCMSPRRLSDVDAGSVQVPSQQVTDNQNKTEIKDSLTKDVFMADGANSSSNDTIINKNDCLSIKEKLNSKLSLALNKRKRESNKNDRPSKQKKIWKKNVKTESGLNEEELSNLKFVSISVDGRVADICIRKSGSRYNFAVLKELEKALIYINNKDNISVTLLTSECGSLCSNLELTSLLDDNVETRSSKAFEVAEAVRSLLCSLEQHSKLVCTGVWGPCSGMALSLMTLSDVTIASENATFVLTDDSAAVLQPGLAVFTSHCQPLPSPLLNNLVIFGRRLSATEALQAGLVSRVLWPDKFLDQIRAIAKDIAAQPTQNLLLKKRLLNLKKNNQSESTFQSCMEAERDILVQYWSSAEGQELIRASIKA